MSTNGLFEGLIGLWRLKLLMSFSDNFTSYRITEEQKQALEYIKLGKRVYVPELHLDKFKCWRVIVDVDFEISTLSMHQNSEDFMRVRVVLPPNMENSMWIDIKDCYPDVSEIIKLEAPIKSLIGNMRGTVRGFDLVDNSVIIRTENSTTRLSRSRYAYKLSEITLDIVHLWNGIPLNTVIQTPYVTLVLKEVADYIWATLYAPNTPMKSMACLGIYPKSDKVLPIHLQGEWKILKTETEQLQQ